MFLTTTPESSIPNPPRLSGAHLTDRRIFCGKRPDPRKIPLTAGGNCSIMLGAMDIFQLRKDF